MECCFKAASSSSEKCHCNEPLYDLEDALGIVQHHDAVSGTAKQHVSYDYSKRVQAGINKASHFVALTVIGLTEAGASIKVSRFAWKLQPDPFQIILVHLPFLPSTESYDIDTMGSYLCFPTLPKAP